MKLTDIPTRSDKGYLHGYLRFYELLLGDLDPAKVLEVGVLKGESLGLWAARWPDADIHGVELGDVDPFDGATIHKGDAYSDDMVTELAADGPFDFILDDGPHDADSQCWFVSRYTSLLSAGGVLAVEDIATDEQATEVVNAVPSEFARFAYWVNLNRGAPDQDWQNHRIVVVDTR